MAAAPAMTTLEPETQAGLNDAVRTLLHTKLSSTPTSNAQSLYNLLHRPSWGGCYSGVASLFLDATEGGFCWSGSLLSTGMHILTAAHCGTNGSGELILKGGEAFFPKGNTGAYTGQGVSRAFAGVKVNPEWTGQVFSGSGDVAVISLGPGRADQRQPLRPAHQQRRTGQDPHQSGLRPSGYWQRQCHLQRRWRFSLWTERL